MAVLQVEQQLYTGVRFQGKARLERQPERKSGRENDGW